MPLSPPSGITSPPSLPPLAPLAEPPRLSESLPPLPWVTPAPVALPPAEQPKSATHRQIATLARQQSLGENLCRAMFAARIHCPFRCLMRAGRETITAS